MFSPVQMPHFCQTHVGSGTIRLVNYPKNHYRVFLIQLFFLFACLGYIRRCTPIIYFHLLVQFSYSRIDYLRIHKHLC